MAPRSPSPSPPSPASQSSTVKAMHAPAKQGLPAVDDPGQVAHSPPAKAGPDTALLSKADDSTGRSDGSAGAEIDLEEASSTSTCRSEDVEIYMNESGGGAAVGEAFSIRSSDAPSSTDASVLPSLGRPNEDSSQTPRATAPSVQAPPTPLLTPNCRDTEATPLSTNTHTVTKGAATSTTSTQTTPDTTIDAGPTTTTSTIDTNSGPPSTPTLHSIRNQLLSPVGDLVDSPITPPATRMSTVPLPEMDDHDDPITLLPRSMEQMDIREAQAALRRSPQDKTRVRGLTVVGGGSTHAPPPSPPLTSLPAGAPPSTAPPQLTFFPNSASAFGHQQLVDSAGTAGRNGSLPTTPTIGMQPSLSYTQSQPLPQLPTFAPALSVINEGGSGVSKDDLHLKGPGASGDAYGGNADDMQMNRAEVTSQQQQQRQASNVTILPVYQRFGTITVSNSVVSFPNSASTPTSSSGSPPNGLSSATSNTSFSGQQKTPNVYINGLPPHFPEEELEALTAPFGVVKSVRTFTRHVRDSESGYGFVLFETVEAAERCIIALRKYRNLHPTFSKQIHKIPGTEYAKAGSHQGSGASEGQGWDGTSVSDEDGDASFKARMEALADPTSTNLYMEGLPLSMDEAALSALVAPHRVVSSRFFQTRLSNPPRIIAFVRLETRAGAEEVIERLHGKMVRGWNDAGSRISVRFADTSEQRELRRQERTMKEGAATGEISPGQLTIAQAALLNLRGQDLRTIPSPLSAGLTSPTSSLPSVTSTLAMKSPPVIGSTSNGGSDWSVQDITSGLPSATFGASGREIIGSSHEFPMNAALGSLGGHGLALGASGIVSGAGAAGRIGRLGNGAAGVDYGSAFAGSPIGTIGSGGGLPPQYRQYQDADALAGMGFNMKSPYQADFTSPQRDAAFGGQQMQSGGMMDPTMKALLESLGGGVDQQQQNEFYRAQLEMAASSSYCQQRSNPNPMMQFPNYGGSGVASTHTGYTPAEEYIMRAHVENAARQRECGGAAVGRANLLQQQHQSATQRKRPSPLDLGRHGGRRQEETGAADIGMGVRGYRMQASLVGMSDEEAFHAQAQAEREATEQQQQMEAAEVQMEREMRSGHQAHTRATTLPHQHQQQPQQQSQKATRRNSILTGPPTASSVVVGGPSASGRQSRHFQRNSMSVSSTTAMRTPQHASASTMGGQMEAQQQQAQTQSVAAHQKKSSIPAGEKMGYRTSYGGQGQPHAQSFQQQQRGQQQEVSQQGMVEGDSSLSHSPASSADSPSLISPALTYSSQHTPSTLSPSTPYFGGFGNQGEGFRGAGVDVGGKGEGSAGVVKGSAGGNGGLTGVNQRLS